MWVHFALLLFAGTALADSTTWKPNHIYHYNVRSRAIAGLTASEQISGVFLNSEVKILVPSLDTLVVQFGDITHASIHTELPTAKWDADLSDREMKYDTVTTIQHPMKVTLRYGEIDQVFAAPGTPMSQVNLAKGILSQLQFQVNEEARKQLMTPWGNKYARELYEIKEQTVSGYCDTLCEVKPLPRDMVKQANLPLDINTLGESGYISVGKYKNYLNCEQTPNYYFAMMHEADSNIFQRYITRSTLYSDMIVAYDKTHFTISVIKTKQILEIRPTLNDMEASKVLSMMDVVLLRIEKADKEILVPTNVLSTGNLTYVYSEEDAFSIEAETYSLDLETMNSRSKESDKNIKTSAESSESGSGNKDRNQGKHSMENDSRFNSREQGYLKRDLDERTSFLKASQLSASGNRVFPDLVKQANVLLHEIAMEIHTPDEILTQHTLEKYTILTSLVRQMNETYLAAMENKLQIMQKTVKQDKKEIIVWKVFRDAVTQAGTMSAFRIIRKWILEGRIKGLEAARILGRLPRVVRQPTMEYIKQFFDLIDKPELKNQMLVNSTAPYAFAELVRYVLVWNRKYTYSSPSFGNNFSRKDEIEVMETYIPYLANELKKAYEEKCSSRIVTYTIALGNLGHPDIIWVFAPYFKGRYEQTRFQRTIMVGALARLCKDYSDRTRSIAYNIYMNDNEYYEVRVMAVQLLLKSNPSLYILQHMAEKTFNELDDQVNNAVITGINSLAELTEPQYEQLSWRARSVQKAMKGGKSSSWFSASIMQDYMNRNKDFEAWYTFNTVGSKTNFIPKAMNLLLGANFSNLAPPALQLQYATSNTQLWEIMREMFGWTVAPTGQSAVDELAEKLNIIHDDKETLEASLLWSNPFGVGLIVIDQHTIQNLVLDILQGYTEASSNSYDITGLASWEFTVNYPSEIGFGLNYRLRTPLLVSVKNKIRENFEMDLVISRKEINRIGFVTAFNGKQYFAGADVGMQLRIPAAITVNQKEKKLDIEYKPLPGTERAKLWQYEVIPYTGNLDYPYFKSIHADKGTQRVIVGTVKKTVKEIKKLFFVHETDEISPDTIKSFEPYRFDRFDEVFKCIFKFLLEGYIAQPLHYTKDIMRTNFHPEEDNSVRISIDYDKLPWNKGQVFEYMDKFGREIPNKLEKKWTNAESLNTLDVRVQVPSNEIDCQCNAALANLEEPTDSEIYFQCKMQNADLSKNLELCIEAELSRTPSACLTMDVLSDKMRKLKAKVRYGNTCEGGKQLNIQGIQKQSEDVKKKILNNEMHQQCKREMAEGNLVMTNYEEMCRAVDFMDELALSVNTDSETLQTLNQNALKLLANKIVPEMNIDFSSNPLWKDSSRLYSIDVNIKRQLNNGNTNVTIASPTGNLQIPIDISILPNFIVDYLSLDVTNQLSRCLLGRTMIKTFDGTRYHVKPSKCPRVLVMNERRNTPEKLAVLFEDLDKGERQITLMRGAETFKFKQNSNGKLEVNGWELDFEKYIAIGQDADIKITRLYSKRFEIIVGITGVTIWYNYVNVIIEVPDDYVGTLRGMCGAKMSNKQLELVAPQGCVVKKAEHLAALYTVVDDKCVDEPTMLEKRQAEQAECKKIEHQQIDLVDELDREENELPVDAYIATHNCYELKTDIIFRSNLACFSMLPLTFCNRQCINDGSEWKVIDYHCWPKSPKTDELIREIRQHGVHPDLIGKGVSTRAKKEIQMRCHLKSGQP